MSLKSGDAPWRRFKASQDRPRGQEEELFGKVSVPGCLFCSVPLFVDFRKGLCQLKADLYAIYYNDLARKVFMVLRQHRL